MGKLISAVSTVTKWRKISRADCYSLADKAAWKRDLDSVSNGKQWTKYTRTLNTFAMIVLFCYMYRKGFWEKQI